MSQSIEPTLSFADAARGRWDAVIVGAGPAGAAAAIALARAGVRTLLLDRASFPRWKVCGCCLSGAALAGLRELDVLETVRRTDLRHYRLHASNASVELSLPRTAAVSREQLDATLVRAAIDSGAAFLDQAHARFGEASGKPGRVVVRSTKSANESVEFSARVVLAADGLGARRRQGDQTKLHSVSRRARLGFGAVFEANDSRFEPGVVFMVAGAHGYVGLVRLEDGRVNVAASFDATALRDGSVADLVRDTLLSSGLTLPERSPTQGWRGVAPLRRRPSRVTGDRMFVVGDAAGYFEPFTGEGMGWAIGSALRVAPIALDAARNGWSRRHADAWERLHRRTIRRRQRICRALAPAIDQPRLVQSFAAVGGATASLAQFFVRRVNAPLPAGGRL
ncbi:MAG: NAD(P)/FAD-dependent oxidoreductase [Phycisphaerales bacterium]